MNIILLLEISSSPTASPYFVGQTDCEGNFLGQSPVEDGTGQNEKIPLFILSQLEKQGARLLSLMTDKGYGGLPLTETKSASVFTLQTKLHCVFVEHGTVGTQSYLRASGRCCQTASKGRH